VALVEFSSCNNGNGCFSEYGVYGCDTADLTSAYACRHYQWTCCGYKQVNSAEEGAYGGICCKVGGGTPSGARTAAPRPNAPISLQPQLPRPVK